MAGAPRASSRRSGTAPGVRVASSTMGLQQPEAEEMISASPTVAGCAPRPSRCSSRGGRTSTSTCPGRRPAARHSGADHAGLAARPGPVAAGAGDAGARGARRAASAATTPALTRSCSARASSDGAAPPRPAGHRGGGGEQDIARTSPASGAGRRRSAPSVSALTSRPSAARSPAAGSGSGRRRAAGAASRLKPNPVGTQRGPEASATTTMPSSRRRARLDGAHRVGQARHALVDLVGRHAGVGQPQGVLAALEQEVRARHDSHAASLAASRKSASTSMLLGQLDPEEVAAVGRAKRASGSCARAPRAAGPRARPARPSPSRSTGRCARDAELGGRSTAPPSPARCRCSSPARGDPSMARPADE